MTNLKDKRPTQCGFCLDLGNPEWFKDWPTLRRHIVVVHIFGSGQ